MKKNYGQIKGPIVMIGFGSIGKGTLPLIFANRFNGRKLSRGFATTPGFEQWPWLLRQFISGCMFAGCDEALPRNRRLFY